MRINLFPLLFLSCLFLLPRCDNGAQAQLAASEEQLAQARATIDSLQQTMTTTPGFIHTVFFWLKDDLTEDQRATFLTNLRTLQQIKTVRAFHIGPPAGTPREVVDNSYDYALIIHFDNAADQDAYQVDPVHLAFVESSQQFWTRVQVYDTLLR